MKKELESEPISAWGYFGYSVLYAIPIVGFIVAIIIACSSNNINKKNFAKSIFCDYIVLIIIVIILAILRINFFKFLMLI